MAVDLTIQKPDMTDDKEITHIREFISSRRAARQRMGKTAGLEGVLLLLHREGATYADMVEYLNLHHGVKITLDGVGKRVRQLLKHGGTARAQPFEPLPQAPAAASPAPPSVARRTGDKPAAVSDPSLVHAPIDGKAAAPSPAFDPGTPAGQGENQPAPYAGLPLGAKYDLASPEHQAALRAFDERERRNREGRKP